MTAISNKCACGRLDLGDFDGMGSTYLDDDARGSHSKVQCYDILGRRLPIRGSSNGV